MRSACLLVLALAAALAGAPRELDAQDQSLGREIRESQDRLDQIRREREQLQREMEQVQTRVRDATREVATIERQVEASIAALSEIDFQSAALSTNVANISDQLARTRRQLAERNEAVRHRLRTVYKAGPLHEVRVLLSAHSFADLLNRYKYLHLITRSDQMLLDDVGKLEAELERQEDELRHTLITLDRLREEKLAEVTELERLESHAQQALRGYRQQEQRTQSRLEQLRRDEQRLTSAMAELERRRLEEERRRVVAGGAPASEGTITTRDLGSLNWPVEGQLAYRFGPERRPNGVELRWNGIGIAAPVGTPVRAVEAGSVVYAGTFEGYGRSVWISHGGGYYTLYLYLATISVGVGDRVAEAQVIGTVGGANTPEGPHLEFQVRVPARGGIPEPVDPLGWLRSRSR